MKQEVKKVEKKVVQVKGKIPIHIGVGAKGGK